MATGQTLSITVGMAGNGARGKVLASTALLSRPGILCSIPEILDSVPYQDSPTETSEF